MDVVAISPHLTADLAGCPVAAPAFTDPAALSASRDGQILFVSDATAGCIRAIDRGLGIVRTLAEPNLTAISGENANFLAGGEFPIPIPQSDGVITIEFKKFGVSLSFTPTILSGNRINLLIVFAPLSWALAATMPGSNQVPARLRATA